MTIPKTDYATINRALIEIDNVYEISETFGEAIEQKVRFICEDACQRSEFWEGGFHMDAGLTAVRHNCFMENK